MAGSTLAEGARVGRCETVYGGRRTLCASQERRPARQRESHAEEKAGSLVAQVASHAAQQSATGSVVVTHRRRTERSGQCFSFPAPATPWRRPSGNASQLPVSRRPAKTHRCGAAGWSLFAAFEPGGRGSRGALGALCTTGTDRGGL